MPPDTNKPGVGGGVTEACLFNDHSQCNNPRCGCTCHVQAAVPVQSDNGHIQVETGPEKSCPSCGAKRPFSETFCRIDGSRLSSLACNICGRGREPSDKFCFNCGSPADAQPTDKPAELPKVINVPSIEPEIDYGRTVLAKLQEELGNVSQPTDGVAEVIEQLAGTQGSFKLVSRPNPNRVRVPAGGQSSGRVQVPQQPVSNGKGFKLPIKPS